jgi:PncC family amidohydrolase
MSFLDAEQSSLAQEIAALLIHRSETVATAESTAGGLISAALLSVPGASRYYAGGGVLYTLNSRTALAGMSPDLFRNYRGTTEEMIYAMAEAMRARLGAIWCVAESGLAGPTGGRPGHMPGRVTIGVAGPVRRRQTVETGSADRQANMIEFARLSLRLLLDALREAAAYRVLHK